MSITYPLAMPSSPSPRQVDFVANNLVSVAVSPFTGSQQVYQWAGQWWEAQIGLPPMLESEAATWVAFLNSLKGRTGTFHIGDPARKTPLGTVPGTPLVNGAQTGGGNTLATKGWTASQTGILKAGDYIQLGSGTTQRLYQVLTDTDSDASGNATLDIFPVLRSEGATDGASITTSNCQGTFRLAGNVNKWQVDYTRVWIISFAAIEAI